MSLRPVKPDMGNASEGSFMTQIDAVRTKILTRKMHIVIQKENHNLEFIRDGVANEYISIFGNIID